jgi:NTP pyrophosphatase (non-canonical NTP hydrolase)
MMDYNQLENLVIEWAENKGILQNGIPIAQAGKTLEEAQELFDAIQQENQEEVIDALGDVFVTIIIQAKLQNLSLLECLESAYNIISKRKGKMIDGTFVKDA